MRVTDAMRFHQVSRNLSSINSRHFEAAQKASTGLRLTTPSQDPLAAADLTKLQASLSQAAGHRAAIKHVLGDAELSEGMLAEAGSLMQRAREIAAQGSNGTLNASDRAALANEVGHIKSELVRIANTKGARGYLFAGLATSTAPFSADGAFAGNDGAHMVQIGAGTSTRVNVSGAQAFTIAGGRDVFGDLDALQTALSTNDATGVRASLDAIEASREQLQRARSDAGMIMERLRTSDQVLERLELDLTKRQAAIAEVDPFEAFSNLTQLGQALERAVAVSQQLLSLGLYSQQ